MSQTTTVPTIPPYVNRAMRLVLHSPVHGMVSKSIMELTFTGRKTGKTYTTPVSYSQHGDEVYVFSHANWWKNLKGGASVTMCIRGREFKGLAVPTAEDKQAVATGLTAHLRKVPVDARFYAVTFDDDGNPKAEEVEKAVQTVVMIRIRQC